MKVGLIARTEADRGLGVQCRNFYDNMPVDRVLVVDMPRSTAYRPGHEFNYPGATHIRYNDRQHVIDEEQARAWMEGLDVVFSVETPYHWQMPKWGREMGVKTVIQGNPEFYRHGQTHFEHLAQPDAWWWPTSWRQHELPAGRIMPVPMEDRMRTTAFPLHPLKAVHVVGVRAHGDRNGTDIVCNAVGSVRATMQMSIYGLDGELPDHRINPQVTVEKFPDGVEDRWSMYEGRHVLVLPRRYGGLCLPALEAAACGLAVIMPDCPPNAELASILINPRRTRSMNLPCGPVVSAETNPLDLAGVLSDLAQSGEVLAEAQAKSYREVPRWHEWRQRYVDELEWVCNGGDHVPAV